MRLIHLTAVGLSVPATTLEFARRLTVIYGASEAGKSYIGEAIDYMFGASRLRDVPEAAGYQQMLLAVEFDGEVVTFSRSLRGGKISVFDGDLRELPTQAPDAILAASHSKDKVDTISHYVLDRLGLSGANIRKNKRNETVALSFRNLAHLVIIGEERMHSRTSPIETGRYETRTTELSALKFLLEGLDDSDLSAGEDPTAFRRLNRAQLAVLERAIAQASRQLEDAPEREECLEMLTRVNAAMRDSSATVSADLGERDRAVAQLNQLSDERHGLERQEAEAQTLVARFSLLDAHYGADIERLGMVKSAGTLLGYFDADECVFCGATAEHQRRDHAIYETVQLTESIDVEVARTSALRKDLNSTLGGLRSAQQESREKLSLMRERTDAVSQLVAELERRIQPVQTKMTELMTRKSELERWLTLWEQVAELQELSASVAQERPETAEQVTDGIGSSTRQRFSAVLRTILASWGVPGSESAALVLDKEPDVALEGRRRADRGKGIRSVLHAGFSTALGEYCIENGLPHPGFIVLDTPVLTYRDPESAMIKADDSEDELNGQADAFVAQTVAQAFYDYLADSPIQTIVLENQTPPEVSAEGCEVIFFTGSTSTGRPGFYPSAG